MDHIAITNILKSYGFKGAEPQYKTINYSIVPKHLSLEDHIEKPQLEILQQLNEEKKCRELVEIHGITLEKTKQFYADKIKEYNDIIDLKHIKNKRNQSQSVEKSNNQAFLRFAGDEGKITNFHISINSKNLIPLLNEINKRSSNEQTIQQSPLSCKRSNRYNQNNTLKTSNNYTNIKYNLQTIKSKQPQNIIQRLEQKLNNFDSLNQSQVSPMNQVNFNEDLSLDMIKKRKSFSIDLRFKRRNSEKKKTNTYVKQLKQEIPKIDLSQLISDSFRQNISSSCQYDDEQEDQQRESQFNYNNLELTQIQYPSPESKIEQFKSIIQDQTEKEQLPDIYKDIKINQNVDFEQRKKILKRRKQVVHDILNKQKPKFLHICGSKFPVINSEQNWNDYNNLRVRIIERELQQKMNQLRGPKDQLQDFENLSILSGPPINTNYITNNLKSDYQDVKVTKIMKQLTALKQ
ncbi:unnamed protein product [Paramecium pentaurelia]|uniref:Uncharacterized protein n=1 Tax=Paramecium pentaurelia TaxID=43138 RepID=A0A8S1TFC4_9CILI|nr:unnamed protein product [Paramecium pentaurelia]